MGACGAGLSGGAAGSSQSPSWIWPCHSPVLSVDAQECLGPVPHAGVLAAEHSGIAVAFKKHPRDHGGGVAPRCHGRFEHAQHGRDDDRNHAVPVALLDGEVFQPGAEEAQGVVEVAGGGAEDLDVAGPAEPLVALRAVRGQRQEVSAHAPQGVLVQAVQQRVGAFEPAGPAHVIVNHDGGDRRRVQLAGPVVHLGVTEAVEREQRFPFFRAVVLSTGSGEGVGVRGGGLAQRAEGEFAALQHLGVAEGDRMPGPAADPDPEASHQVLAEVQHRGTGRCGQDVADRQFLDPADRRGHGRGGHGPVPFGDTRGKPVGVVESGFGPACLGAAGVEGFAGVDAAGNERAGRGGPPAGAAGHGLPLAVGVLEAELHPDGGLLAVEGLREAVEAVFLREPAAGEPDPDGVGTGCEERGDVRGFVVEPVRVGGPARLQDLVVHLRSIDFCLVDAVGGGVERGPDQPGAHREFVPQLAGLAQRPFPGRSGKADGFGRPRAVQPAAHQG